MSPKKLLSVLGIAVLLGIFAISNSAYALKGLSKMDRPDGAESRGSTDEAGERTRKGSIYDAASYLIDIGGVAVSKADFQQNSGINPETGEPYSDSTINREVTSMVAVGLATEDANGNISIAPGINHDVLDAINQAVEELVPRKEAGTGRALGLRRFNLADLEDNVKAEIARIVKENKLQNNTAVNIVAFESEFAERNGEALLSVVEALREDQIAVIINATSRELVLIPALAAKVAAGEIHVEPVLPESPVAQQFSDMFTNQKYVGFKGDLDTLRKNIAEGNVKV